MGRTLLTHVHKRFERVQRPQRPSKGCGTWLADEPTTMCPTLVTPTPLDHLPPPTSLWARMATAVQHFADCSGVRTEWLADTPGPWSPAAPQADLMLDVLDAALRNANEHGRAHQVVARVRASSGDLSLLVRDDGRGAPPSAFIPRSGGTLSCLRERADRLGGWLQIDSQLGQGTQLILSLPVPFHRTNG